MSSVRLAVLTLAIGSLPGIVQAQTAGGAAAQNPSTGSERTWSVSAAADTYLIPDAGNYVQPTVTFDRGALHLEGRHNYEDLGTSSGFLGWNLSLGRTIVLELTPMLGAVGGRIEGVVPALELDVAWKRLELYTELEFVIATGRGDNFLYNWSELSVWASDWFRAGLVTQRTRASRPSLDIQSGLMVGLEFSKITPTLCVFNPGADDQFLIASIGVEF